MILSFHFAGTLRAKLRSGLIRHRNTLVVVAASVLTVALTLHLLAPVAVPNLAQPVNAARALDVAQDWAKGDVIALVRHAERCDRSSMPCLGPLDGITVRATRTAQVVGEDFKQLGLNNVDIYSSQMTRTRQTADAMFARPVAARSKNRWVRAWATTFSTVFRGLPGSRPCTTSALRYGRGGRSACSRFVKAAI